MMLFLDFTNNFIFNSVRGYLSFDSMGLYRGFKILDQIIAFYLDTYGKLKSYS